ncbi:phosphotransferase [Bifidobacterium fermentum]|uniref:Phosphotransferase n=2 Tax=Bifidobacterium TaxID=1678 RepID=A0AB39UC78_9BIFI
MKLSPIPSDAASVRAIFPESLACLALGCTIFDTSSSPEAKVYRIDRCRDMTGNGDGFGDATAFGDGRRIFLKTARPGRLRHEAVMTRFFHDRGLAAEVLMHETLPTPDNDADDGFSQRDWLITSEVKGKDCTHEMYLSDPKRLCQMLAATLHLLKGMPIDDFPIVKHDNPLPLSWRNCSRALNTLADNGDFVNDDSLCINTDAHYYTDRFGDASIPEIAKVFQKHRHELSSDTIIHGDYCLPNIILDDWKLSGFVDMDSTCLADQHVDVFWALWTLQFNLGTHEFDDRFLDAYGREFINEDALRTVAAAEVFG